MSKKLKVLGALIVLLVVAIVVGGQEKQQTLQPFVASSSCTRFVSPTGSDSAAGTTISTPWKTLNGRTGAALSNQVICFRGGTYAAGVQPSEFNVVGASRGTLTNVTFTAYGCEEPVLDAGSGLFSGFLFPAGGSSNITVSGLNFRNYVPTSSGVIVVGDGAGGPVTDVIVEDSTFTNIGRVGTPGEQLLMHGVYLGGGYADALAQRQRNWTIRRNVFTSIGGDAITSYHSYGARNVLIEDNVFVDARHGIGISREGQADWTIDNNTFYNNTVNGLSLYDFAETPQPYPTSPSITITDNIGVGDFARPFSVGQQVVNDGYASKVNESNNNWFYAPSNAPIAYGGSDGGFTPYTLAAYQSLTGEGTGSQSVDPLFVNAAAGNFALQPGSPSTGKGARFASFPSCGSSTTTTTAAPGATTTTTTTTPVGFPNNASASPDPVSCVGGTRYQAEAMTISGPGDVPVSANGKYRDWTTDSAANQQLGFTLPASSGSWLWRIRYQHTGSNQTFWPYNAGTYAPPIVLPSSGFNTWATYDMTVAMSGASNIGRLYLVGGTSTLVRLDYVDVCPDPITAPTTTTTTSVTTTTIASRVVTLSAYVDTNSDGVRQPAERQMRSTRWRLFNPAGTQIAGGKLETVSGTLNVPVASGWVVKWYPPLPATTPVTVTIPSSGAASIVIGGCCLNNI